MAEEDEAAGMAALSICEALIISLIEKGVLTAEEARGALEDAAAAHQRNGLIAKARRRQDLAASIIEQLATQLDAAGRTGD